MKSLAALFILIISFWFAAFSKAEAYQIPQFTSCVNPSGQIKVNYDNGTHGIVGSSAAYVGKDAVYFLSGDALTQCFCSSEGKGIQTNWWKVSSLTEGEINSLKSQGWNFVPNGALWGLEQAPYLAFNSEYICRSSQGFTPTTDISGPGGSGGSIAGISAGVGRVLGLATTGNTKFLYSVLLISITSFLLGLFFKKRTKNFSKK